MPSAAAQNRPSTRRPCPSFTPSQIKPPSPAQTATAAPAPGTAAQSERGLFCGTLPAAPESPVQPFLWRVLSQRYQTPKAAAATPRTPRKAPCNLFSRSAGAEKRSRHAAQGEKWTIFDPFFGKFPPDFRGFSEKFSEKIRPPWVGKRISRFIVDSR